jgi:ABC-2 type transport system permease protein
VQKLVFVVGGFFIPIDLYPPWLAGIARWLPFAFSAYWPASTMIGFSVRGFLTALAGAAAYVALIGGFAALLYSRGRRRVHAQGG